MNPERNEQLAILLNLVGDEAVKTAIGNLDEGNATEINRLLGALKQEPPTEREIDSVLDDFTRFFNFAIDQIKRDEEEALQNAESEADAESDIEENFDVEFETIKTFAKPELTGDTKKDLNLYHPYQVANGIRNDNSKAIAIVVDCLEEAHAAKTIEFLPPEVQLDVFLLLTEPIEVSPVVETQILQGALEAAGKIEHRAPSSDRTEQIIGLARSLSKSVRGPVLEKLLAHDEELGKQVKSQIYQFDDIKRLTDKDVQKVLAQSNSDALVTSLVEADDEIKAKVFGNISKRARQTMEDELEFRSSVSEDELKIAHKSIVDVIVKLDEDGEITLE